MLLSIENIVKNFEQGKDTLKVLNNICLRVDEKKNIGLIGPSGSGKSTLLNIIGLIDAPTRGTLKIDNINCDILDQDQRTAFRRKNIGFIFQNNQLLHDFNCQENIALPLILNGTGYNAAVLKAQEMLEKLNLQEKFKSKISILSGGEKQRVSVLRALIKKPYILLADEPTGSLDENNSIKVFNEILKLANSQNTLTITATHNLNLIKKFDSCYKLEKGQLIEYT